MSPRRGESAALATALVGCFVALVPAAARACSVCFSPAAENPEAAGLGWAIALLLVPVFVIQGVLAWLVVRILRRGRGLDPEAARS